MGFSTNSNEELDTTTKNILCLEPFRITLASKINICKLTYSILKLKKMKNELTNSMLVSCNNLININGLQQGDPIDKAISKFLNGEKIEKNFNTLKQFLFSSELRRQYALSQIKYN